ncbi:hypothetical protein ACP70R_015170 [Stipagrostis hirtigluma subsp. patula]
MAAPAALLMDELVEEVLLRVPPEDPARLLRAALVCKRWGRLVSGRGFRRRYRDLHRTAPVLGFLTFLADVPYVAHFVPTSSFRPPRADHTSWRALHSAHGRILLYRTPWSHWEPEVSHLSVWDPVTDERRELPTLSPELYPESPGWNAAVLCAAAGCDHLDCHRGPFLVVFVGNVSDKVVACVYSSEAGAWSKPTDVQEHGDLFILGAKVIVGNALYFKYEDSNKLLKFDWTTQEMSVIHLPRKFSLRRIVLMAMEDGKLGFAIMNKSRLHLWSMEFGPSGGARWAQSRDIELDAVLPVGALSNKPHIAGHSDGTGVILMWTNDGFFSVDLKSGRIKNVGKGHGYVDTVVPFVNFCTPAIRAACTDERSGAGISS